MGVYTAKIIGVTDGFVIDTNETDSGSVIPGQVTELTLKVITEKEAKIVINNDVKENDNAVKTGDDSNVGLMLCLSIGAFSMLMLLLFLKRKTR